MISIRYSIPPPLISRYTSVISEATGFNYIAIRRHIVGFNPCFLEGRDYRCKTAKLISKPFQSTLPRRERQGELDGAFDSTGFNPRSHEGSDSIRAISSLTCFSFQSTLPRRERRMWYITKKTSKCFNPRSHEGSDAEGASTPSGATAFQSTLPRRERRGISRGDH